MLKVSDSVNPLGRLTTRTTNAATMPAKMMAI